MTDHMTCPLDGLELPTGDELSAHMIRAHDTALEEAIRIRETGLKDLAARLEAAYKLIGWQPKRIAEEVEKKVTGMRPGGYL